ncbi:MAG: thioredoxin family protein [Candidatus Sulfomarinibacteraceae bacterium]
MATIALDQANFDQQVLTEGIVMVDCWAPWCQGCGEFEPVFDAASERHPAHTFAKVNTKTEGELTKKLGVKHIPTLILFRDGILLLRQPGYVPAEGLDEIIEKAEGLDMDHVRAGMEKEETTTRSSG